MGLMYGNMMQFSINIKPLTGLKTMKNKSISHKDKIFIETMLTDKRIHVPTGTKYL
jgi:hypothetical protein